MKDLLVVNAIGGLCNRMRSIATGLNLARTSNRRLKVIWRNNNDLGANFHDLFRPMPEDVSLHEPSATEYCLKWEMPRKRNLYLSALFQRLAYNATYCDGSNLTGFIDREDDLKHEISSAEGNVLIISGLSVGGYNPDDLRSLFRPSAAVEKLIQRRVGQFDSHTAGVHIRRTDNITAIRESPLDIFISEMQRLLDHSPNTNFFLASDDADVMRALVRKFGKKVICGDDKADRKTLRGMTNATADLWALSKTTHILGSFYSSFTDIAAVLGNIPLKIMSGDPAKR